MNPANPGARPERDETDSKLRDERDRTDHELVRRGAALDDDADQVIELARQRADALVDATPQVTRERATADAALADERAVQRKALRSLLAFERDETDGRLLVERANADQAVASRDDFLAIVSHDVRGMLAGLVLSADLLAQTPGEGVVGERTHREAERIRRYAARMNRLIGDLIDIVSMEIGQLHVAPSRGDATVLLTETVDTFQSVAAGRGVAMTVEAPPGPALVRFDHDRILQVLANLVGNSLKFTPAGGTVALRLAHVPGAIEIEVRDTGCGIPAEQIDTVFERFTQGARADRRGLGLGLYIARCIIDAHGGAIRLDSEPGAGSRFCFTLPV